MTPTSLMKCKGLLDESIKMLDAIIRHPLSDAKTAESHERYEAQRNSFQEARTEVEQILNGVSIKNVLRNQLETANILTNCIKKDAQAFDANPHLLAQALQIVNQITRDVESTGLCDEPFNGLCGL